MLAFFLSALESPEDRHLFTALYEQHRDSMERIALNILRDPHDAEDAVQNAFLQIIRHFDQVPNIPSDRLIFWIISITQNEARLLLRKGRRAMPLDDLDGWDGRTGGEADYAELLDMLDQLPETYQIVLEMKFLTGCTDREIAQRLGLSQTAVSTRVSRGRMLLITFTCSAAQRLFITPRIRMCMTLK